MNETPVDYDDVELRRLLLLALSILDRRNATASGRNPAYFQENGIRLSSLGLAALHKLFEAEHRLSDVAIGRIIGIAPKSVADHRKKWKEVHEDSI